MEASLSLAAFLAVLGNVCLAGLGQSQPLPPNWQASSEVKPPVEAPRTNPDQSSQREPEINALALRAMLPKAPTGERMCADVDRLASLNLTADARTLLNAMRGFCNLPTTDVSSTDIRRALKDRDIAFKVNGESFTIFQRGPVDDPEIIRMRGVSQGPETCCSIQNGVWRRFEGTDLWVMRLRLKGLRYATISQQTSRSLDPTPSTSFTYRGDLGPAGPAKVETLKGKIERYEVFSPQLNETRSVVVYLPPREDQDYRFPVVISEGGDVENFASISEALVKNGKIRPVILVGVVAGNDGIVGPARAVPQHIARAQDYSPNRPDSTFKQYLSFLVETVRPMLIDRFSASEQRIDWVVTGASQGGALALNAALERPDIFGHSWPMSIAGTNPEFETFATPVMKSKFRFSAGYYEETFLVNSQLATSAIQNSGGDVLARWFSDGHNPDQWDRAFADNLMSMFPPKEVVGSTK
ncbi:MAG TPA: hypothetical protein DIU09_12330 [Hyphomonadaceae bacterium]|nr:hypothetical protein [Hyphomonadaceae bacterium]